MFLLKLFRKNIKWTQKFLFTVVQNVGVGKIFLKEAAFIDWKIE